MKPKEVVMKMSDSKQIQKLFSFPSIPTVSIHPDLWAEIIRPTDAGDLRLDRIAELRSAINAGTYRVSAAGLAEKLMDHMRSTD